VAVDTLEPRGGHNSWCGESMRKLKVLLICHNHAAVRPGGVEAYTLELYNAMWDSGDLEPILLSRSGRPDSSIDGYHEGTPLASLDDDPNQYLFYTDPSGYDWLYGRSRDKAVLTRAFRDFLLAYRPDVVHFQHTVRIGYEAIRITRNALPRVPILYTLHEFLPICHRSGQMVRTETEDLCDEESPRRCHECFPEISPQEFFMRKRFIQSHLAEVDLFISPSKFLIERYVDWGIPKAKIRYEPYGRRINDRSSKTAEDRPRTRFGFFGTLNPFKGPQVLLRAMEILGPDFDGHLWIHGANLKLQPKAFHEEIERLLAVTSRTVTFAGPYTNRDVGELMASVDWVVVPSIWWENSPLVIQEAFLNWRPVICSDIGGMAEHVADGTNGLHFRRGSAQSLAGALRRACSNSPLWEKLRSGIPDVHSMRNHLAALYRIYDEVVAARSSIGAIESRERLDGYGRENASS
jgi:glycosyltransferase involved in cell wall biosynthesis